MEICQIFLLLATVSYCQATEADTITDEKHPNVTKTPSPIDRNVTSPFVCTDPNEIKAKCGDIFETSCQNPTGPLSGYLCCPMCVCKPGTIRNSQGKCVPLLECKADCLDSQDFKLCGSACPATCQDLKPQGCTKQCVVGCYCKKGLFFRFGMGDGCVCEKDCNIQYGPGPAVFCPDFKI